MTQKMYGSHKHSAIHAKALGHYNGPVRRLGFYNGAAKKLGHHNNAGSGGKSNLQMEMHPHY